MAVVHLHLAQAHVHGLVGAQFGRVHEEAVLHLHHGVVVVGGDV